MALRNWRIGERISAPTTGTRIKTAFSRVAPVDIIDRKQLARTGASNLADTGQFLSAAQGAGIQGGAGLGAANASASQINLRGLGAGTTLLLINGRRVNPTAYGTVGTFSDLSLMPLAAVERIEKSQLEEVVVTNTIPPRGDAKKCKKIRTLSVARLLAEAVQSIHDETSVSVLFI